jgi:hypothetical protein
MIRPVHSVATRVLTGLGAIVAGLVAIGYAFIFSGIASPVPRDLGTVVIPVEQGAVPVYLSDGRPAFVVRTADGVAVVDARPPLAPGEPGRLVAWCAGVFVDRGTLTYLADGTLVTGSAPSGLIVYPTRSASGDLIVASDGHPAGVRTGEVVPFCDPADAVAHAPDAGEVFDPSVAADEEPPGWVWLEGSLVAIRGQVLLCDAGGDCGTGMVAHGIDPAKVGIDGLDFDGLFLGRVRDGAIEELQYVAQPEDVP